MAKKQRRRLSSGKTVDYARCKGCLAKYRGVIKNEQGKIERVIGCQTGCPVLAGCLVTRI